MSDPIRGVAPQDTLVSALLYHSLASIYIIAQILPAKQHPNYDHVLAGRNYCCICFCVCNLISF